LRGEPGLQVRFVPVRRAAPNQIGARIDPPIRREMRERVTLVFVQTTYASPSSALRGANSGEHRTSNMIR